MDYIRELQNASITLEANVSEAATIRLADAQNTVYAVLSMGVLTAYTSKKITWDGKATDGNTAGLKAGAYVPVGKYNIVLTLGTGSTARNFVTTAAVKVLPPLEVTEVKLDENTVILSKNQSRVSFKVNHTTAALVDYYRADGKKVATIKCNATDTAVNSSLWDGKATEGNNAGLKPEEELPQGEYTVKIRVGSIETTAGKVIVKPFSEVRSLTSVDYIKGLQNGSITLEANVSEQASIKLMDAQNTVYAVLSMGVLSSYSPKTITWNGKVTEGNTAGLKEGVYVPVGKYTIVLTFGIGSTARTFMTNTFVKVLPPLEITDVKVDEPTVVFSKGNSSVSFKVNHRTVALLDYYRADGKRVATIKCNAVDVGTNSSSWDGTATDGNEAGIQVGKEVSQGDYTVKLRVGGLETNVGKVTVKEFSQVRSLRTVDFIRNLQESSITLEANLPEQVIIKIADAQNKIYATLNMGTVTPFVPKTIAWNGKATADNTAGITPGGYVPTGKYNVVVTLGAGSASTVSIEGSISVQPALEIIDADISDEFTLSSGSAIIRYDTNHAAQGVVTIARGDGKSVAVLEHNSRADSVNTIKWDGRGTAGNDAGVKTGEFVPKGIYTASITIGKVTKIAGSVTVKPYSVLSEVRAVDFIEYMQMGSITFSSSLSDVASVKLIDGEGRIYALLNAGIVTQLQPKTISWNGKVTSGNTAGIKVGSSAPVGQYTIVITIEEGATAVTNTAGVINVREPFAIRNVNASEEFILGKSMPDLSFKANYDCEIDIKILNASDVVVHRTTLNNVRADVATNWNWSGKGVGETYVPAGRYKAQFSANSVAAESGFMTAKEMLQTPGSLRVEIVNDVVIAYWNNIANAIGYEIKLYKEGQLVYTDRNIGNVNSFDLTSAVGSNRVGKYAFTIKAMGSSYYIDSNESTQIPFTFTKLVESPRISDVLVDRGDDSAIAYWNAVPNAVGYRLMLTKSGQSDRVIEANNRTNMDISGYVRSSGEGLYYLKIMAVADSGYLDSYWSSAYSFYYSPPDSPTPDPVILRTPTVLSVDYGLGDVFTLKWDSISNSVSYTVMVCDMAGREVYRENNVTLNKLILNNSRVTMGTTYKFKVIARGDSRKYLDSAESDYVVFSTLFAAGEGTLANPYGVATAKHIMEIENSPGSHYKQLNNIDLGSYTNFNSIGSVYQRFTGSYNGDGKRITNLYISKPGTDYVGLFAYIGLGGEVRNLGVSNGNINGNNHVGSIAGFSAGRIYNCYSTSSVTGAGSSVGGIAGTNDGGMISNCYTTGSVTGYETVGGILGRMEESTSSGAAVEFCYAAGSINITKADGYKQGGLVGENAGGTVRNGIFLTNAVTNYNLNAVGSNAGIGTNIAGKDTPDMLRSATYYNWDFLGTWTILEGVGLPTLRVFA